MAVSTWCSKLYHDVNFRSVRRSWEEDGEPPYMPRPHTRPKGAGWISYGGPGGNRAYEVTMAYDRAQHIRACQVAAIRRTERFRLSCGPSCPYHPDESLDDDTEGSGSEGNPILE